MTKVLFLDIDGVLNKISTTERINHPEYCSFTGLDLSLVELFLNWYKRHRDEVVIVLSSTWRHSEILEDEIKAHGIEFIDTTDKTGCRKQEIKFWIFDNQLVGEYVILDDCDWDFDPDVFVQTDPEVGLTEEDLEKVDRILQLT